MAISAIEIVKDAYGCFQCDDIEGVISALAPDVQWTAVGPPDNHLKLFGPRVGHAKVREYFDQLGQQLDDAERTAPTFLADGDTVVVQGNIKGRVRATGRRVDTDWVHVLTVADGKITSYKEFLDSAQIVAASATASPPAAAPAA
jgi:ketosteroid isomerase-like protein